MLQRDGGRIATGRHDPNAGTFCAPGTLIGFEPDQLETILAGLGSSGLTDPDSIPEIPAQPVTQPGDLWLLGDHRVGCGDSTNSADVAQVLPGTQPHLMVTDPLRGRL